MKPATRLALAFAVGWIAGGVIVIAWAIATWGNR